MRFAIYGRKSVYSDKSDSVDNQFRMCRAHIETMYPGKAESVQEYSDEGFTGANTDRPGLKMLLQDVSDGLVDALVIYQLDRLSRNVRDFANIYAALEEKGITFVALKDNIDTSTPIGKAMMYVSMVFAQMERETIANRVRDNLHGLARKGYWTVGFTPIGYTKKRIQVGAKKHYTLEIDPEGAEFIRYLFREYLSSERSLRHLGHILADQGIKGSRGGYFEEARLHEILTNPLYCEATAELYDYYESLGCNMEGSAPKEEWDGSHGAMVFGRKVMKDMKKKRAAKSDWIVSVGLHPPIISAADFLAVQDRLKKNNFDKVSKYAPSLLKGIVRCRCGSKMRLNRKKARDGESNILSYSCITRARKGKGACDMRAVSAYLLDDEVMKVFRKIETDENAIMKYVEAGKKKTGEPGKKIRELASKRASYEAKARNISALLSDYSDSTAAKHLIGQLEDLDRNIEALKREEQILKREESVEENSRKTAKEKAAEISAKMKEWKTLDAFQMNAFAKEIIKGCTWDGETLTIIL